MLLAALRAVEAAAVAASEWVGRGDKDAVDHAATEAMRRVLGNTPLRAEVVTGEGELDEAPMLAQGERLGWGERAVDVAVDPVEGTTCAAAGLPGSAAMIALSSPGGLLSAPDTYMDKLVVPAAAAGRVNMGAPVTETLRVLSESLGLPVRDLMIAVTDRPRHAALVGEVRRCGARVALFRDGDVFEALGVVLGNSGAHALMGRGGAPEGVLTAAALRGLGGEIQGRFTPGDARQRARLKALGLSVDQVYSTRELASGADVVFAMTGVTSTNVVRGIHRTHGTVRVHSLVTTGGLPGYRRLNLTLPC